MQGGVKAFYLKKHNEESINKRLQLHNARNTYICSNEDPDSWKVVPSI